MLARVARQFQLHFSSRSRCALAAVCVGSVAVSAVFASLGRQDAVQLDRSSSVRLVTTWWIALGEGRGPDAISAILVSPDSLDIVIGDSRIQQYRITEFLAYSAGAEPSTVPDCFLITCQRSPEVSGEVRRFRLRRTGTISINIVEIKRGEADIDLGEFLDGTAALGEPSDLPSGRSENVRDRDTLAWGVQRASLLRIQCLSLRMCRARTYLAALWRRSRWWMGPAIRTT